jgi:glucose-6-phosphate 1-dehydrogenase
VAFRIGEKERKLLPLTCTEVIGQFRKPPSVMQQNALAQNHLRFRISPEMTIAIATTVLAAGEMLKGETVEMVASHHPEPDAMDAYERVLGDAMAGILRTLLDRIMWKRHGVSSIRC